MTRRCAILLAVLIGAPVCHGQYPTGQYPPGQYPPGQYPPGQYPTNSPVRLPGGVPVNVPVPTIPMPKRTPKGDKKSADDANHDDLKMTLRGVDGALRELGEKDLYLEAAAKRLLKFRLLVKTQFRDKDGQPVRDSLLKPGDQISVQVNKDDPETALRVILSRKGTDAERAAAERPFDRDAAKTPVVEDTHGVGSIEVVDDAGSSPGETAADPGRPRLQRAPEAPQDDPGRLETQSYDGIIAEARAAAESFTEDLPNFMVQQATTRYASFTIPAQWNVMDLVTADVVCVNGKEEYRNVLLNGKPTREPIEKTGTWSTGEFVTTLQDVLSPMTAAEFSRGGEEEIAGRTALVYKLSVRKAHSHWRLVAPDGKSEAPAYAGRIWIDKETHRVLRIEQEAGALPAGFPFDKAESTLEYGYVPIGAKNYVLPVKSENLACERGTARCTRNEIEFRDYRRFSSDSTITYDKLLPASY